MNKVIRLVRKASTASPREWWTRSSQLAFALRNYVGSRAGGAALPAQGHRRALGLKPGDLCAWWSNRRTQWFIDAERTSQLQSASALPDSEVPWILERADDVLKDRIPLFSNDILEYQGANRWHRDFIVNKTAPRKFHGLVPYLDPNVVGDSKHVWEPNRFAWAVWLGIAYQITGKAKYADKFRLWTLDWFRSNPYPIGINYCSALELAYRNYAWLWSLSLFADYLGTEEQLLDSLLQGIWTASRHVEENLSTYFAPNTHILGEAFGLFAVGAAIPEFRDAARWRNAGLKILEDESHKQFYQDGMHRELSSSYHIYTTDIYLQTTLIGIESGFRVPQRIEETTRRAARRLAELVPPSLIMPQFNDCDGGRITSLVPNPMDAGPSLMAAEGLFTNESFLPCPQARRGYSLLMNRLTPPTTSREPLRRATANVPIDRDLHRIYDSGVASYRSPDGDYVVFRASDFGYHDCPHSHDAGLSILLQLNNTPVFVDSGVGSYTQSEACRNEFRCATGKNTILINGQGPSVPDGWFSWSKQTDSELVSMRRFHDGFTARGKHDGFTSSPDCHTFVQREIIMLDVGIIAIIDRWDSDSPISVDSRFTLAPDLDIDPAQNLLRTAKGLTFHYAGMPLIAGEDLEFLHNEEAYSKNYGHISVTNAITYRHRECARGGIVTFVSRRGPAKPIQSSTVRFQEHGVNVQFDITPTGVQLSDATAIEQLN